MAPNFSSLGSAQLLCLTSDLVTSRHGTATQTLTRFVFSRCDMPLVTSSCRIKSYYNQAGLRGAIAFSLAMRNTASMQKQLILSTTLVIVLVTVLFFGGGTVTVLQFFKIRVGLGCFRSHPLSQGPALHATNQRAPSPSTWHQRGNGVLLRGNGVFPRGNDVFTIP
jgi:hypothetical protein